jgi:hypothetical protein
MQGSWEPRQATSASKVKFYLMLFTLLLLLVSMYASKMIVLQAPLVRLLSQAAIIDSITHLFEHCDLQLIPCFPLHVVSLHGSARRQPGTSSA